MRPYGSYGPRFQLLTNMKDGIMHTMLRRSRGFASAAVFLVAACSGTESGTTDVDVSPDTDDQKASFGNGHSVGQGLALWPSELTSTP